MLRGPSPVAEGLVGDDLLGCGPFDKMGTTIKDTSKKVSVVGGGRGRVRGLCAAAPRCVRAAFAARTRAFGANTIKFRGGKWDEFGLAARARGRARGACSQRREYL